MGGACRGGQYTRLMRHLLIILGMLCCSVGVCAEPVDIEARLDGETDGDAHWETPGLYALLQAAEAWSEDAALMPRTVRAEELALVVADPPAYRGQVFSIEGWLQQVERIKLKRPGLAYGDQLTRWVVLLGDGGQGSADQVALIYLLDPSGRWAQAVPNARQTVSVEAMFFKTLELPAQTGKSERFPVFVGRVAQTVLPAQTTAYRGGGLAWILGGVGFGLAMLWLVRSLRGRTPVRRKTNANQGEAPGASEVLRREDLPGDPAEALDVLAGEASAAEEGQG